ncbi:MAG TPA: tail fiber protein [Candidatus Sulfotelmatobacter sp.]|nr:tail fiber protein [Candidatus Sulfotelmatobacter sp.]
MSDPFVAEIRIFPFNFAPRGWAFCDGQILPISQNTALFSLLGTTYGGDGKSTFALPNLQGSTPLQPGQGPGLSLRDLGEIGGEQNVTLLQTEMPAHIHGALGAAGGGENNPSTNAWASGIKTGPSLYTPSNANNTSMSPQALSITGGSLPHNNMMPFLTLNFCIALQGIFPPRT